MHVRKLIKPLAMILNKPCFFPQLNIIRIPRQLDYFHQYQQRVSALIGEARTRQLVNRALVLITVGGNDFVNNYYLVPFSVRSTQFTLPDYVDYLISEYGKILEVRTFLFFTFSCLVNGPHFCYIFTCKFYMMSHENRKWC